MTSFKRTIRFRLTMGIIAVVVLANAMVSLVTILHVNRVLIEEVQTRVRLNLNSAQGIFNSHQRLVAGFLRAVALDGPIAAAVAEDDREGLTRLLLRVQEEGGMDMVAALDPRGRVIRRSRNPKLAGDDLSQNPVIRRTAKRQEPTSGTVIVPRWALERESRELVERAHFVIRPTPGAPRAPEAASSDGMAIAAAVPLFDSGHRFIGILYAANLINRRFGIVDEIKNEAFHHLRYLGREIGTATIFQGDLRISTNVMTEEGTRAIGTLLSQQVREQVLERGGVWAARAFVVNAWYITAYQPLRDPDGRIVGALYVGLLEAAFQRPQNQIFTVFLAIMGGTTLISLLLLFFVAKLILRPIGRILEMSRRVGEGDLSARVGIRPPGEMGRLCHAIDAMAEAVKEREEQLKRATSQQIGQSEKLASIGRLAAGVAHEINNPLTGVLTFSHLLRKKPNLDEQDQQDLDLIIRETTRVREIVRDLLDFARGTPSAMMPLDINEVIGQTMKLVKSQKDFTNVTLVEDLAQGLPPLQADRNQVQQVLLNLSLNACEAMGGTGTLTICTRAAGGNLLITVTDTGCGIKPEHLSRIFDPFFTTKPVGKGTGLGLSVTYGIVAQHHGSITVESAAGRGTSFIITLPLAPRSEPTEKA